LAQALVPNPGALGDIEKSQLAAIRTEMAVFESSGVRGRGLQLVYNYLQSFHQRQSRLKEHFLLPASCAPKYDRDWLTSR